LGWLRCRLGCRFFSVSSVCRWFSVKMVYFFRFVFWLSMVVGSSATLAPNGLRLGEGGDFHHKCSYEALTSNLRKTVIRSTEPPLLPNRCYQLPFCPPEVLSVGFCRVCLLRTSAVACTLFYFCSFGLCGVAKANVSANVWAL
jgi:hypothetical protein